MRLQGMRLALMILACVVFAGYASAQVISRAGDINNGSNSSYVWYYGSSGMRMNIVYTAQEVASGASTSGALANGGLLEEIRIKRRSSGTTNYNNVQVRMANSTRTPTGLSNSVSTNASSTQVTTMGPTSTTLQQINRNGNNYERFPFTTQWQWDGTSNILIDIAWDSMSGYWYTNYGSGRYVRFYYGGGAPNQTSLNSQYTAANWDIEFVFNVQGLTVTTTAGTAQQAYANASGVNNAGLPVAEFDVDSGAATGSELLEIELEEVGTANAQAAIQQVAVFRDSAQGATGTFDAADTMIGTATTFNGADGNATFTVQSGERQFGAQETRTYFIVVWLSGQGVPTQTLDFLVSDITVDNNSYANGVPSPAMTPMLGVIIRTPDFVFSDASAPNPGTAYVQLSGNVLQAFQVAYPAGPNNTMGSITIAADGSGNDAADYISLDLYRDTNNNNFFDQGVDTVVSLAGSAFTADNGSATFTLISSQSGFQAGDVRLYFVVAAYATSTVDGSSFQSRVSAASGTLPGTNLVGVPAPQAGTGYLGGDFNAGLIINATGLIVTPLGPNIAQNNAAVNIIDSDSQGPNSFGEDFFSFELFAANENWSVNDITFSASGTGNDGTAFSELALYEDINANGQFDGPGTDTLATNGIGNFTADNGIYTAALANPAQAANTTRRFFLTARMAGTATFGQTFNVRLEATNAMTAGVGTVIGAPTVDSLSLQIDEGLMTVTNNGPTTAQPINSNSIGNLGYGEMLLDFSLACVNDPFVVNSVDITAGGTGNDVQAFSEITLYEDTNGNGNFDGASTDNRASAQLITRFPVNNGTLTFNLSNNQLPLGTTRRFFVMAKFAGTALGGQTFTARVANVAAQPVNGGVVVGAPTADSAGVIIAQSALSVSMSPLQGSDKATVKKTGAPFTFPLGVVRLSVANGDATVTGINFSVAGTGEWFINIAQTNGVELWLDDGNGNFEATTDTLLYSGGGNNPQVQTVFNQPVVIPNSQYRDVFVMLNVLGSAGGSIPQTYRMSVANATDVSVSGGASVAMGMPAPVSRELSVVDFRVVSMTPLSSFNPGGATITLNGSGLIGTTALLIDGVPCGGTPVVSVDGTSVTGFIVPRGKGGAKTVELVTSLIGTETLNFSFTYLGGAPLDGGGSSSVNTPSASSCSLVGGSNDSAWILLALLSLIAVAGSSLKRNRA